MFKHKALLSGLALSTAVGSAVAADFGTTTEKQLTSWPFIVYNFGLSNDIGESAVMPEGYLRDKSRSADQQVKVSNNLKVEYVTRDIGNKADMMALYPETNHTHLIACIEGGVEDLENGKKNPSVQAVELSTGTVTTILRGMDRCDGIRLTPWGTVLATEETDDGAAYEIIDPLNTVENTITDRDTGAISGSTAANIIKRTALPTMAWEGLAVLSSGVVIAGDELRPGSYEDDNGNPDTDGGAIFKFVPDQLATGGQISSLGDSPFIAGSVYALQASCRDSKRQYGQGCEVGNAAWIPVDGAIARKDANDKGATGYYRPEDLHEDPAYTGEGERFCWTNTGNKGASNWGEVMCAVDLKPDVAEADGLNVIINRMIVGNSDFNAPDNFSFQPNTQLHYVIEDNSNGDIWSCLPDGDDRDTMTDGCVKFFSVVDTSAEPTGFMFDETGLTAYVVIQHSDDAEGTEFDGYATDDLLKITGFTMPMNADMLNSKLNFSGGTAALGANNTIQLNGINFDNNSLSATIQINMDGTWSLQ